MGPLSQIQLEAGSAEVGMRRQSRDGPDHLPAYQGVSPTHP